MYNTYITNKKGETLQLSGNESKWQITNIEGLGPVNANLIITDLAGLDGGRFNSAKLETRNVVITLRLKGDIEGNRLTLYRYCQPKEPITFYFSHPRRSVYARGYVDTSPVGLFSKTEQMQVSIVCPDPYFFATTGDTRELTDTVGTLTFPLAINAGEPVAFSEYSVTGDTIIINDSEVSTGVVFTVNILEDLSTFEIQDKTAGEYLRLNYQFLAGDVVTINTGRGEKDIRLLRGGVSSGLFSALDVPGSRFLQLSPGRNRYAFTADGGSGDSKLTVTMSYNKKYEGV